MPTKTVAIHLTKAEIKRLLHGLTSYEMMVPLTEETQELHNGLCEKLDEATDELEEDET
jgi:hypothetical protein